MIDHLTVVPKDKMQDRATGTFVSVEGIDGSGTTTVTNRLGEELDNVLTTTEPAEQHWTGEVAREAINRDDTHPMTDLMFFIGDRANHMKHTIDPALYRGETVISDRYLLSTLAYQQEHLSETLENPLQFIREMMSEWVRYPDVTILLDCPLDVAAERRGDAEGDKYEATTFQRRVRRNYRDLRSEDRVEVIDATQPLDEVVTQAKRLVEIYR